MTGEQLYHSALLLMGESVDSLHHHEAALSALTLLCGTFAPAVLAYHTAYGTEGSLPERIGSFTEELGIPTVILPCFVYGLAAELCRIDHKELADRFTEKCAQVLMAFWDTLPASPQAIRDIYPI